MPTFKDPAKNREYSRLYHQTYKNRDPNLPHQSLKKDKITDYTYKGVPIVLMGKAGRPPNGGVARAMEQGIFPVEKYIEAATLYAATGSSQKVSDMTGIPHPIIKSWVKQLKFKDILEEIRQENDEKIDAKFCLLVDSALDQLGDRIDNGDYHYDGKRGELVRKPVSARDLAITTAVNIDKRQLLRGKPTSRTENLGEGRRLELLAEQFIAMARGEKKAEAIIDVKNVEDVEIIEETPNVI